MTTKEITQVVNFDEEYKQRQEEQTESMELNTLKQELLPPPNPILVKNYCFDGVNTALKIVFKQFLGCSTFNFGQKELTQLTQLQKYDLDIGYFDTIFRPLPEFFSRPKKRLIKQNSRTDEETEASRISTNSSSKELDDPNVIRFDFLSKNGNSSSTSTTSKKRENVLGIRGVEVYKKFDNQSQNMIPFSHQRYYASYFYDMRQISFDENSLVKQNPISKQSLRIIQNTKNEDNEREQITKQNSLQFQEQNVNPETLKTEALRSILSQHQKPIEKYQQLIFDSNFESGNLFASFKVTDKEYDLVLQNDINSKGNTQWFFFSVTNAAKNQTTIFNIINFMKNSSLFSDGMQPVVFSQRECDENGTGWKRDGFKISYKKTNVLREGSTSSYYYKLQFSYTFKYSNDSVYFAHCFPYTFSDLQKYTTQICNDPLRSSFITKKLLCQTIAKNQCNILTITAPQGVSMQLDNQEQQQIIQSQNLNSEFLCRPPELVEKKQVVFLTARQHPGETPSSYMIEGAIEFLTDPHNVDAAFLREHFIFKVIPMMNPDGVIHGNYRCNLQGVDLNRQWLNPSKEVHPTVYFAKNVIQKHMAENKCRFVCDFHGHSKKMNSFFYGNPNEDDAVIPRIIPMECAEINPYIDFRSSTFRCSSDKESTLRQALGNNTFQKNCSVYTFEASFFGYQKGGQKGHFSVSDLRDLGRDILLGFKRAVELEIIDEISSFQSNNQIQNNKLKTQAEDHRRRLVEIIERKETIIQQSVADSGSDSCPSEDELNKKELSSIQGKKITRKILSLSPNSKDTRFNYKDSASKKKPLVLLREDRNGSNSPNLTHFSFNLTRDKGTQTERLFINDEDMQQSPTNAKPNEVYQRRSSSFGQRNRKISGDSVLSVGRASPISVQQLRPKTSNFLISSPQPSSYYPREKRSFYGQIQSRKNIGNTQGSDVSIFQSYLNSRCESSFEEIQLFDNNTDLSGIKQSNSLLDSADISQELMNSIEKKNSMPSVQDNTEKLKISKLQYFSSKNKSYEQIEDVKGNLKQPQQTTQIKDSYESWLQSVRMNKIIEKNRTQSPNFYSSGFQVSSYSYRQQARMQAVESLHKMFRSFSPPITATNNNNKPQLADSVSDDLPESFSHKGKEKRNATVQTQITLIIRFGESIHNFSNVTSQFKGDLNDTQYNQQQHENEQINKKQDINQESFYLEKETFTMLKHEQQNQQIHQIKEMIQQPQERLSKTLILDNQLTPQKKYASGFSPQTSIQQTQSQSATSNKICGFTVKCNQNHLLPFSPKKRMFTAVKSPNTQQTRRKSNRITEIIEPQICDQNDQNNSMSAKQTKTKNLLHIGSNSPNVKVRLNSQLSVNPCIQSNLEQDLSSPFRKTGIPKINRTKKSENIWIADSYRKSNSNIL